VFGAKTTLGIDIGAQDVKLVEVQHTRNGARIVRAARLTFPAHHIDSETERDWQVEHVLRSFLERQPLRAAAVATGVPMSWATVRTIELPPAKPEDVARIVRFEAESHIPLPLDDVEFDHSLLSRNGSRQEVLIAACRKSLVAARLVPLERLGLRVEGVDVNALATVNCFAADPIALGGVALIDLGTETTEVSILDRQGIPRLMRSLSVGGAALTRAIAQDTGLDLDAAETEKKQNGLCGPAGERYEEGLETQPHVAAWAEELVEEVRRSLQAFRAAPGGGPVERLLLLGGGAMTLGLIAFLADRLGLPVQIGQPWERFDVAPEVTEQSHLFAVATGLALDRRERLADINLLPRMPADAWARRQRQANLLWGMALILMVFVLGSVGVRWSVGRKANQLKGMQAQIDLLEQHVQELPTVGNLPQQVETLRRLAAEARAGSNWLDILRDVSERKPPGAWLTDLSCDKNRSAVFKGIALSQVAVEDLMDALHETNHFAEVRLDYISEVEKETRLVYDFQITCTLRTE